MRNHAEHQLYLTPEMLEILDEPERLARERLARQQQLIARIKVVLPKEFK